MHTRTTMWEFNWTSMSCCGIWPFGRPAGYRRILEDCPDSSDRWRKEIDFGLPPGVAVGDLIQDRGDKKTLKQAYLLAVQSNNISDYIRRFDSVKIPASCKVVVSAQLAKLKSVQNVIWNTMLAMAVGGLTIDEEGLQTLLEKQAGDTVALMEIEKLATAITLDESTNWATDISKMVVTTTPGPVNATASKIIKESDCGDLPESEATLPVVVDTVYGGPAIKISKKQLNSM